MNGVDESAELVGPAAVECAAKLRRVFTDSENWVEHFIDDATGARWVLDYPQSGMHGGGSPRLRRVE